MTHATSSNPAEPTLPRTAHWALTGVLSLALAATAGCEEDDATTSAEAKKQGELSVDGYKVVMGKKGKKPSSSPGMKEEPTGNEGARSDDQLVREPTAPDPHEGTFSLEEAVRGLGTDGTLVAELDTTLGTMFCDLYAEKAPRTVANFIGLARGKRQWWNPKAGTWVASRYYDGLHFHRVIPEFLVQTGDPLNDGTGEIGYELPNENEDARYDEAGLLVMADEGEAGQFFITDGPASQLASEDTHYTVFGKCLQTDVIHRLARVPQSGRPDHRPITPTVLERVFVKRVRGGADKAERTAPKPARGMEGKPEGASPGPGAH